MPDLPLHDHPAVRHILASEFCPKYPCAKPGGTMTLVAADEGFGWLFDGIGDSPAFVGIKPDMAGDFLELAAVRAMCLSPNVSALIFGPCYEPERGAFYATVFSDERYGGETPALDFFAPTSLEAVLAAYQATVMQEPRRE